MNDLEKNLKNLKELYEEIGGNDTLFFDTMQKGCVQDEESKRNEILNRLDEVIKNVKNIKKLREIAKIEIENISIFNEIADNLEEQIENLGNLDGIEKLKNELSASLKIIVKSHLILKNGYVDYQKRCDELLK